MTWGGSLESCVILMIYRGFMAFQISGNIIRTSSQAKSELEFQASSAAMDNMRKEEAMKTTYHEDTTSTDGSSTDEYNTWNPPYPPCPPSAGNSLSDAIRLVAMVT